VTIPDEIVAEFHLHAGTELEWTKGDKGKIIVQPVKSRVELAAELKGAGRKWLNGQGAQVEQLLRDRKLDDELDRQDE
jgi:antitoxin component of MazEF toxin-antitoxin module